MSIQRPPLSQEERDHCAKQAAPIITILNRAHFAGFAKSKVTDAIEFDAERAYGSLNQADRDKLMHDRVPLNLIEQADFAFRDNLIRHIVRERFEKGSQAVGALARNHKRCRVCKEALRQPEVGEMVKIECPPYSGKFQMVQAYSGNLCDACDHKREEREKEDAAAAVRIRWAEMTPAAHHAPFDPQYPGLKPDARGYAVQNKRLKDKWENEKLWKTWRWLWLTGPTGTGKSHLSSRALLAAMKDGLSGYRITFKAWSEANAPNMSYTLTEWAEGIKRQCYDAEILLFDEMGGDNERTQAKALLALLEHRTDNRMPTIINSQGGGEYFMQQFGKWDEDKSRASAMVRRLEENSRI